MARKTTRPRGFMENWNPEDKTIELIDNIRNVLDENIEILPLTLRQIFYMLHSDYGFDKTEKSYKRLCEIATKARRSRRLDMTSIRDDELNMKQPFFWDSEEDLISSYKYNARQFKMDPQLDQSRR